MLSVPEGHLAVLNRNNYYLLANFLTDGLDSAEIQRPLRMQWGLDRNRAVRMRRRRVGTLLALNLDEAWDEENVGQLGIPTYLDETGGERGTVGTRWNGCHLWGFHAGDIPAPVLQPFMPGYCKQKRSPKSVT